MRARRSRAADLQPRSFSRGHETLSFRPVCGIFERALVRREFAFFPAFFSPASPLPPHDGFRLYCPISCLVIGQVIPSVCDRTFLGTCNLTHCPLRYVRMICNFSYKFQTSSFIIYFSFHRKTFHSKCYS